VSSHISLIRIAASLFACFFLCAPFLTAQIPFQKEISYAQNMQVNSLINTPNGGAVLCGVVGVAPNRKTFLLRLDPCGQLEWMRTYQIGTENEGQHAIVTIDGGYLVTGRAYDSFSGWDLFALKTDGIGNEKWTQYFRGGNDEIGLSVADDQLNGYVVTGLTNSYGAGLSDILVIKIGLFGQIEWQRQFGGGNHESGTTVRVNLAHEIFITGATHSFGGTPYNGFFLKVSPTGQLEQFKTYDLGGSEIFRGMAMAPNGDWLFSGYTNFGNANSDHDLFLMRTDPLGNPLWSKTYAGATDERAYQLTLLTDGGVVLGGFADGSGGGDWDLLAVKTDSLGSLQWSVAYGTPQSEASNLGSMHYLIGNNNRGGIWLGSSIVDPVGIDRPYVIFSDANGLSDTTCSFLPQLMTESSVSVSVQQPVPDVKAFGFSTPSPISIATAQPLLVPHCENAELELGPDTTLCPGQSYLLDPGNYPQATYLWTGGTTDTNLWVSQPGAYWVELTVDGCPKRDTAVIDFFPAQNLFEDPDTTICAGDSFLLSVPSYLQQWTWGSGGSAGSQWIGEAGTYSLRGFDGSCWWEDSLVVHVSPQPTVDLGADTVICPGDTLTLYAFFPGASYGWQDGSNQSFFPAIDSAWYFVETSIGSCRAQDSIRIGYRTLPQPDLGADSSLCLGDSLRLTPGFTGQAYRWQDGSNTSFLEINQGGDYWVEVYDGHCWGRDSLRLWSLFSGAVDLGRDTIICSNQGLELDPGFPGATHLWQDSLLAETLSVDSSGWYWVEVLLPLCQDRDSVFVEVKDPPVWQFAQDSLHLCAGDSLLVFADPGQPGLSYRWHDGLRDSSRWVSEAGFYGLEVNDGLCSSIDSFRLTLDPLPELDLGTDTSLCEGELLLLFDQKGAPDLLWSNQLSSPWLEITDGGWYWAERMENDCMSRDSVFVRDIPLPATALPADTVLCAQTPLVFQLPANDLEYQWSSGHSGPDFQTEEAGWHWVRSSREHCSLIDSILLRYVPRDSLDLGEDSLFCKNESLILIPRQLPVSGQYEWQDGSSAPNLTVSEAGWYSLSVKTDHCGRLTDSIFVAEISCQCPLFFPSAFSPNADGINEQFGAIGDCSPLVFELSVFNRWGKRVFQSNSLVDHWSGRDAGEGVYTWVCRYTYRARGGWKDSYQRGTVTLIR
jgi:hypothetical protein